MRNKLKNFSIIFLLLVIVILVIFGIFYAVKNHNRSEIYTVDTKDIKHTINSSQIDKIVLPKSTLKILYKDLPKTKETINELDFKTFKKLFQTNKKSLLILVKDGCAYCENFLPIVENTLKELNLNIYKINISKFNKSELNEMFNYIDFAGTPTTYVIEKGNAKHSLSGLVDSESLKAFIDYFYIRSN